MKTEINLLITLIEKVIELEKLEIERLSLKPVPEYRKGNDKETIWTAKNENGIAFDAWIKELDNETDTLKSELDSFQRSCSFDSVRYSEMFNEWDELCWVKIKLINYKNKLSKRPIFLAGKGSDFDEIIELFNPMRKFMKKDGVGTEKMPKKSKFQEKIEFMNKRNIVLDEKPISKQRKSFSEALNDAINKNGVFINNSAKLYAERKEAMDKMNKDLSDATAKIQEFIKKKNEPIKTFSDVINKIKDMPFAHPDSEQPMHNKRCMYGNYEPKYIINIDGKKFEIDKPIGSNKNGIYTIKKIIE